MSVIDDATLLKMAEAEILGEAKRAAVRHSIAGVSGWQPCSVKPNKLFLTNTLLHTLAGNRVITKKTNEKGEKVMKSKTRDRKLYQIGKSERTNFVYQKPKKTEEKVMINTTSSKFKSTPISENKSVTESVEKNEKCSVKKKPK